MDFLFKVVVVLLLAIISHEFGHYIVLKALKKKSVFVFNIWRMGFKIDDSMSYIEHLLCLSFGVVAGLLFIIFCYSEYFVFNFIAYMAFCVFDIYEIYRSIKLKRLIYG